MNSVGFRLLILALAPMVVLMPLLLFLGMTRWTADYDEVLIANVESDLRIAEQYLSRLMVQTGDELQAVAGSVEFAETPPALEASPQLDIRADLDRLLLLDTSEPPREQKRFGLTAAQISEVQKRLTSLQPGTISSVKRIRENSRLLRDQGITQADLAELFDYLAQTNAVEWLAGDCRDFRYLGGL